MAGKILDLTLTAVPAGTQSIELGDGTRATLVSLPVSTPQSVAIAAAGSTISAASPGWSSTVVTLSGGGATALNGQTGVIDASTIFTLNRLLLLNITGSGVQGWVLTAGTDAEGEFVVHPANYHVTTFPYVFKKIL